MKNTIKLWAVLVLAALIGFVAISCDDGTPTPPTKTVSVGTQTGTLTDGTAGEVTYTVTTANIANGEYTADVANLPNGVSVKGKVTIANNSGTLTLEGDNTTVIGITSTLTLTIDGTISAAFTLTIVCKDCLNVLCGCGFDYELNTEENGYIVTGLRDKELTELIIPDLYKGLPVVAIADEAFFDEPNNEGEEFTSVTIGKNVLTIGYCAFFKCSYLETITFAIDSKLELIGESAFEDCISLIAIEIPANVTIIDESAFQDCTNLETVTFAPGSKLELIGDSAFQECENLTSIIIPASVTIIDEYAFGECSSLASVTFATGSLLESIGDMAFYRCTSLTAIEIPASVTFIDEWAFHSTGLTSVTFAVGSDISEIGNRAFPEGVSGGGNSLREAYNQANPKHGTYTREPDGEEWTKE
jgi:hypothetical protein